MPSSSAILAASTIGTSSQKISLCPTKVRLSNLPTSAWLPKNNIQQTLAVVQPFTCHRNVTSDAFHLATNPPRTMFGPWASFSSTSHVDATLGSELSHATRRILLTFAILTFSNPSFLSPTNLMLFFV